MTEVLIAIGIVSAIGLVAGIGLSIASKLMAVPTDEKYEAVRGALPGANCGACGYSGCDGYAAAIAAGEAECNKCPVGGETTAAALSDILGVEVVLDKKVAFVACAGTEAKTSDKYEYTGIRTCAAANLLYNGPSGCKYGCLGFGDCAAACDENGITIFSGVASVNRDLCKGCEKCVKACPKGIISMVPYDYKTMVHCSSKDKGGVAMKICKAACIGCTKCAKECPENAITIENNLAKINPDLCTGCGKCAVVCPNHCIS